ncbi:hypothetical protein [Bradymonas sediminis]|uniref:Uncharacterized protein n=1 Tax=Bradymonas sediminis TaxID=1548548 RepID=A0A2Z4FG03_9DELT|nr:hypothetical protein [Bradymonas sediminis]AWV87843.1 hypothetical protein DN745_00240 [Bradymonas sediminis]TDP73940.1 hypothetical protein DFR33_105274 [Bradymonas sediminis]
MKEMMRPKYAQLFTAALLVACAGLGACATPSDPSLSPQERAFQRGQTTIRAGVKDASEESASVEEFVVRARQNPCQCDAPPDEIYIHERWTRVYFEGDKAVLGALRKAHAGAEERARIETLLVRGALGARTRPSPRGIAYPVFEVRALD